MAKIIIANALLSWMLLLPMTQAAFRAGVSEIDATLPVGVPLAGFSARKTKFWPIPRPTKYTSLMEPSTGHLDPTHAKALVLDDGDGNQFCIVTVDAIGADGTLRKLAHTKAAAQGFPIPLENMIMSGSHSHSGPGGITPEFLWEFAPATDLIVPELQDMMAEKMVEAMLKAYSNLSAATIGIGTTQIHNYTKNRRAGDSPFLTPGDIDPNAAVIAINDMEGHPLATVWNFAIHGTCLGSHNLQSSADVMGGVNTYLEHNLVGGVAFFINADAGDIAPTADACHGNSTQAWAGVYGLAEHIATFRQTVKHTSEVKLVVKSQVVEFGLTDLNLTLARIENCTQGGPLDICGICNFLNCDFHLRLDSAWVEESPRFTAVKLTLGTTPYVLVTVPGEALSGLGFEIRSDMKKLGYDEMILAGYSNNHMGYFATVQEYDVGGYESLLTFWGSGTAEKVRQSCYDVVKLLP